MDINRQDLEYLLTTLLTCSGSYSHSEYIDTGVIYRVAENNNVQFSFDRSEDEYVVAKRSDYAVGDKVLVKGQNIGYGNEEIFPLPILDTIVEIEGEGDEREFDLKKLGAWFMLNEIDKAD